MKRLIAAVLCICLMFAGIPGEGRYSHGAEPNVACEMYSSNANPIYANKSDDVLLNIAFTDAATVSAVTISDRLATKRTGTSEWVVDGDFLWKEGYLPFEISYVYCDEYGDEIEKTTNTLTSGVAVLFDAAAPANLSPTLQAESSDSIRVTANASGLEGCVAPAHDYGYSFRLYSATGTFAGSFYGWPNQAYLFEGLGNNTRYKASTRIKDAAGNFGVFSGFTFIYTLSVDPASLNITGRTNKSLSYEIDRSNQTAGTENKVRLSNAGGVVSETDFGEMTTGTFLGLEEGAEYQIRIITRNSDNVENPPQLFWSGSTKSLPEGEITFPLNDVYLKGGESFILEGTYDDVDGDEVTISATIGGIDGIVEVGSTTWSAVWDESLLPEGLQNGISVYLSDDGGSGETELQWVNTLVVDRTCPDKPEISVDSSELTKESVLVTLSGEEDARMIYNLDGGADLPYESPFMVEENASITAAQYDFAGNMSVESTMAIDWIDKVPPVGSVAYSTTSPTNGTVIATLTTVDENEVTITNNGGANTFEFTTNGSFTFEFTDAAGNSGSAIAAVTCIDKTAPNSPIIELSPQNGISTSVVKISISNEEESASIEYCICGSGDEAEKDWQSYEEPLSFSEKGQWLLFARAIDSAGNVSVESTSQLTLKNKREKESNQSPGSIDHYNIRLPYLISKGATIGIGEIGEFYDIDGNPLDLSGFVIESSDTNILNFLEDGTLIANNPGRVTVTIAGPDSCVHVSVQIEIDETSGEGSGVGFNDIKNHWAEEYITDFRNDSYIKGYEDGDFRPQGNMTAAEFLTVLERVRMDKLGGKTIARSDEEPSITGGDWSRYYCLSAFSRMDLDEVKGAFGDTIVIDVPITRGQVAFILAQSENWTDEACDVVPFKDIQNHKYKNSIRSAFDTGILNGYPDGSFHPDSLITRAEMTVLFSRYIHYLDNL